MLQHAREARQASEVVDAAGGLLTRGEAKRALAGDAGAMQMVQAAGANAVLARIVFERRVAQALAEAAGDVLLSAECGALLVGSVAADALWRGSKAGDSPAQAARRVLLAIGSRVAP